MDVEKLHKIDALVAEKVMGWRIAKISRVDAWIDDKNLLHHYKDMWHPSTEISDAWEVVEKLGIIPNSFYIGYKTDKNGKKIYRAFFQKENPITTLIHTYEADAETAPLAICLAALKAVGVDIEKI